MHPMRSISSEALSQQSRRLRDRIRPKEICADVLANDGYALGEEDLFGGEETLEEGRVITSQKMVYQPSKQEWDDHQRTHIPFRKWCACCAKGKCTAGAHKRSSKSASEIEDAIPVISFDYMGPKSKEDRSEKIDSLCI